MRRLFVFIVLVSIAAGLSLPARAVTPEEQLSDPVLEQRARDLSQQLRCLVCQNQSIDDSDAELARDLRREVRVQLLAGKDDGDILDALRGQYGDYVLLRPPVQRATYLLWAVPMLLAALAILIFIFQRRSSHNPRQNKEADPSPPIADLAKTPHIALSRWQVALGLVVMLAVSLGLYSWLGRPEISASPLADRAEAISVARAEQQLEAQATKTALTQAIGYAKTRPKSIDAQLALAMAAARDGAYAQEIAALNTALALTDGDTSIKSMLAEAFTRQADGLVTLPARALITEVLAVHPSEPRALYLIGLAGFQDGDFERAMQYWTKLQAVSNADAPWHAMLADNIALAAEGAKLPVPDEFVPSGPDAQMLAEAAKLSDAEQQAMIRTMVEGLEARLEQTPDDSAGWQRLIQSRRVLGDEAGLIRALAGAAKARPNSKIAQIALLEELLPLEDSSAYYGFAEQAIARLAETNANGENGAGGLDYLFFKGYFAGLRGDNQTAITAWSKLQNQLPEGTEFSRRITTQIEALRAKE